MEGDEKVMTIKMLMKFNETPMTRYPYIGSKG